jgi:fructose-bisphosphate aldolase class I
MTTTTSTNDFDAMMAKVKSADGFIAALDQSGGSTPKALGEYGVPSDMYVEGEESMYEAVHTMRTRIITSPAFTGEKILGAILFENTMDRQIEGLPTGDYLWQTKNVVPFLKCDKGLADEQDGVQLMKEMPTLDELLARAKLAGMYGTKMRSVINSANEEGIKAVVLQQFAVGQQIIGHGLIPIIEPEVNIKSDTKEECEDILKKYLLESLDALSPDQNVMLKVSLPTKVNHYKECIDHPRCIRVVALSGGYSREKANEILAQQDGMIASFSRAILEGLSYGQSPEEFDATLSASVDAIFAASKSA